MNRLTASAWLLVVGFCVTLVTWATLGIVPVTILVTGGFLILLSGLLFGYAEFAEDTAPAVVAVIVGSFISGVWILSSLV